VTTGRASFCARKPLNFLHALKKKPERTLPFPQEANATSCGCDA
jgi:hypothetical protein